MTLFLIIFLLAVGTILAFWTMVTSVREGTIHDSSRGLAIVAASCYISAAALQITEILS